MKFLFVLGIICLTYTSQYVVIGTEVEIVTKSNVLFFHGKTFEENQKYELIDFVQISEHPKFNLSRSTMMYLHGFKDGPSNESVHTVIEAYLRRTDYNVIALDWSALASEGLSMANVLRIAMGNARELGGLLATILHNWFSPDGCDINRFHLVGHSVGAQMAGYIGREIIYLSDEKQILPRITALDPADSKLRDFTVSRNDARFVDIIHTDASLYGSLHSIGHVNFWPNGRITLQPGCPRRDYLPFSSNDLCSHQSSWRFYAESVRSSSNVEFWAVQASKYSDFIAGRTENNSLTRMGINCSPQTPEGNYYLQTNPSEPFAKGLDGIRYVDPDHPGDSLTLE